MKPYFRIERLESYRTLTVAKVREQFELHGFSDVRIELGDRGYGEAWLNGELVRIVPDPKPPPKPKPVPCRDSGPGKAKCQLPIGHRGKHFHKFRDGESVGWTGKKVESK